MCRTFCHCHLALQILQVINSNLWFMFGNCYCNAMKVNKRKWQIRDGHTGQLDIPCSINEMRKWHFAALVALLRTSKVSTENMDGINTKLISCVRAHRPFIHSFIRSLIAQSRTWSCPLPVKLKMLQWFFGFICCLFYHNLFIFDEQKMVFRS